MFQPVRWMFGAGRPRTFRNPTCRPIVMLSLAVALLLTSGCGVRIRELKTEKAMLQARVMQLDQDLSVAREDLADSRRSVTALTQDTVRRTRELEEMREQLRRATEEASQARLTLSQSQDQRQADVDQRLADAMEREQRYKDQIEQLETRIASMEVEALATEDKVEELQAELGQSRDALASIEAELKSALEENLRLSTDLRTRNEAVAALERQRAGLQEELKAAEEQLETLGSDLRMARGEAEEKEAERVRLEEELKAAHAETEAREQAAREARGNFPAAASSATVNATEARAKEVFAAQISANSAEVRPGPGKVRLILFSDELFRPGTTNISDAGLQVLSVLEDFLKELNYGAIVVEGHTDDVPVRHMNYADNWALGSARATEVVRWLAGRPGIEPESLSAQSYSFYAPLEDNRTAEGRRVNRRVEIAIWLTDGE